MCSRNRNNRGSDNDVCFAVVVAAWAHGLKNPDLWYSSHVIHQHQEGEGEGGTVSLLCNSMSEDTMLYMCELCILCCTSHTVSIAHWKQKQGNVGGHYHITSTEWAPGFHFAVCSLLIDTQSSQWKKCKHVCVDAWMMCDVFWIYIYFPLLFFSALQYTFQILSPALLQVV